MVSRLVVAITGATGGIGQAIARRFANQGAVLALMSRNEENCFSLAESLGKDHLPLTCDVSVSSQVDQSFMHIKEQLGGLDVLVNCAGVSKDRLLLRLSDIELDEMMKVNLFGPIFCSRAALKLMLPQKKGRIITIGSVVGSIGNPGQVGYSASKAGLVGMTRSLAKEVASRGVTVNLVNPGFITTSMTSELLRENICQRIPLGHFGHPEDVAGIVSFLAGPGASYITGQTIGVDGGLG